MCFCLLVELDVFVLFCTSSGNGNVFHQKLAFSWRGTKKPKKPKILDSSGLAFAKTLKSLVFLVFLVPPQEMATFSTKSLHFPGGVPKNQKNQRFWTLQPRLRQDSKIFGFFGFLVPPQEMATFSTKSLHFPGGVPKKPKKPKILDSSGLAFAKTLKSLVFCFVWHLLRKWQRFPPKLAFSWRGTKKTKKTKILHSSGLAFAKTLKSLVFLVFWYLLRKWQRFPPKACIFLEGYQKNQKNQRFWTLQASPSPRL